MSSRAYWLDLFTISTWQEFIDAGGTVSGFRERQLSLVRQMKPGDYLLCYLTGISRFLGILEVISEPFEDNNLIWKEDIFPSRVKVKPVVLLTPETAVPVRELYGQLTILPPAVDEAVWGVYFRGSPRQVKETDGEVVVRAVLEAERNPVNRPFDLAKLKRRAEVVETKKIGQVTIPEHEEPTPTEAEAPKDATAHTEIQWLLLKLGNDMGFDVWAARNDRGREYNGTRFADLPRMRKELPRQFDEGTNRTIELIDVLWLRGNTFVAAFEVESTTSIYSGLLRMSDLLSMQPNINIPLYLVAPEERREKVIDEVNRPTFSRLSPPMYEACRFISFTKLRDQLKQVGPFVRHLKPDFVSETLSESCKA